MKIDVTQAAGVWSAPNYLSETPEGAFRTLDNVIVRSKGVVEPRPGQPKLTDLSGIDAGLTFVNRIPKAVGARAVTSAANLLAGVICHAGTDVLTAPTTILQSNVSAPDETIKRMAFAIAASSTYYTTSNGVRRLDGSTSTLAGAPVGRISWSNSFAVTNANGFLANNQSVRYRALLVTIDSAGREIVGEPGGSVVIVNPAASTAGVGGLVRTAGNTVTVTTTTPHNFKVDDSPVLAPGEANFPAGAKQIASVTGATTFTYVEGGANVASTIPHTFDIGAANGSVRVLLPSTVTTTTVIRVFRSVVSPGASSTPSEDCFLVWEGSPSAANISAGFIQIADNTPEVLLGPIGYFSPSAETQVSVNAAPPLAYDLSPFGDSLFFARTRQPHQLELRMLATGGSEGIVFATAFSITVGAVTETFTFNVFSAGTPIVYVTNSVALDVERTSLSLVDNINASSTLCTAEYVSGVDDAPGQIVLTARDFSTTPFTVLCTRPAAFNPQLPTSGVFKTSTQQNQSARICWSKPGLPNAVPPLNFADVGDTNEAILRILELRDKLYVIKESSIWTVSGSYGRYSIDRLDDTTIPAGADTFAVCANQIYGLSTQGVVAISDTGVGLVSLPIQDVLDALLETRGNATVQPGDPLRTLRRVAWGCAHETDRLYLLGLPRGQDSETCEDIWCFSTLAKAWMRWPVSRSCGFAEPRFDKLVFGDGRLPILRRSGVFSEQPQFYDDTAQVNITGVALYTGDDCLVTLDDASPVNVGDRLTQTLVAGKTAAGFVVAKSGNVLTVRGSYGWDLGLAVALQAYDVAVEWIPNPLTSPSDDKLAQEVQLLFKESNYRTMVVSVASDMDFSSTVTAVKAVNGAGESTWGSSGWGNRRGPRNERVLVPRKTNRGQYFSVRLDIREMTSWRLNGMSMVFDQNDAKGKR